MSKWCSVVLHLNVLRWIFLLILHRQKYNHIQKLNDNWKNSNNKKAISVNVLIFGMCLKLGASIRLKCSVWYNKPVRFSNKHGVFLGS